MQFNYIAYDIERGVDKGRIDADNADEVRSELVQKSYKPLHIKPAWQPPRLEDLFPSFFKVGKAEQVRFARTMATMMESGGSLLRTLEMVQQETRNRVMRRIVETMRKKLEDGGSFSEALAEHPKVFDPIFISVVEVGEYTGQLGTALEHMAQVMQKDAEARAKAMSALMYPLAIMGLSMLTLFVLMSVAMPPPSLIHLKSWTPNFHL